MLIVVSSCLIGNQVRYDGDSKANAYVMQRLGRYCQFMPLCPEHEAYGTPRPTIRVVKHTERPAEQLAVEENVSGIDVTEPLATAITQQLLTIEKEAVCGFIMKAKSPSCGYGSTPVFDGDTEIDVANGLFTEALLTRFPDIPIIEEADLENNWQRELFLARIFCFQELLTLQQNEITTEVLATFHQRHLDLLCCFNAQAAKELTTLVASSTNSDTDIITTYLTTFKQVLNTDVSLSEFSDALETLCNMKFAACAESRLALEAALEQLASGELLLHDFGLIYQQHQQVSGGKALENSLCRPYPEDLMTRTN